MIRRATVKDFRRIRKLERRCFARPLRKEQLRGLLMNPNAHSLVFSEGRRLVASLILYCEGPSVKVLTVAVDPAFRRRGIGRMLMLEAEKIARWLKVPRMTLEVSTGNSPAIGLYTTLGFRFEGVIENYYAWQDDAYLMAKQI